MPQEAISLLEETCGRRTAQFTFGTAIKGWNDFKSFSVKVDIVKLHTHPLEG